MSTVLITGANRGLGLEFARQYHERGWRIHACCRQPDDAPELMAMRSPSFLVHTLDVSDFARIAELAREIDEPLDLLLNNAGIYGPNKMFLGSIDYDAWAEVFAVNSMAPMRLAECFVEHVARSERKVIACLSSFMGSMAGNISGRHYLYRSSKAALNAVVKSLAVDLKPRGIHVVTLHPGWVKTDMGGSDADLEIPDSVRGVIGLLDGINAEHTGRFFNYDGSQVPW